MYPPKHKNEVLELMKGAYDLHTHTSPDFGARALNDRELLEQADAYGMAAVSYTHLDVYKRQCPHFPGCPSYRSRKYHGQICLCHSGRISPDPG